MKGLIIITVALTQFTCCLAQDTMVWDNLVPINKAYAQNMYNPKTKTVNLSYNYSNKWDLDGDKKNDSLFFIGNGAAHTYFYLRIILSSDGIARDFPSVQLDMPYFVSKELLKKHGQNAGIQLVIDDFNDDNITDVYLNFNNPFGAIPKLWRQQGVNTKCVLLYCKENKLRVSDH